MKPCTKCGQLKPESDFYVKRGKPASACKDCMRVANKTRKKQQYHENPEKYRQIGREQYYRHQDEAIERARKYKEENKDAIKARRDERRDELNTRNKEWRDNNKDKVKATHRSWYERNREKKLAQNKEWDRKNRETRNARRNERAKERRIEDPVYLLSMRIRVRIHDLFRDAASRLRSEEIVGCDWKTFHYHLESTFVENYGILPDFDDMEIHIDHIIPLSSAQTEDDIYRLNHFTNLQLLLSCDNREKSDKLDWAA